MLLLYALVACSDPELDEPDRRPPPEDEPAFQTGAFCESIASPLEDPPSFYESNPTLPDTGGGGGLVAGDPAAHGVDPAALERAAEELAALPFTWSLLVLRDGALIFERYFNGSSADDSNNVHSSSKSMLALLVGAAIDRGDIRGLDQPVSELLPELFAEASEEKRAITVQQLLTMSAGFRWTEDVSEYQLEREEDWLQAIVDLPLSTPPGQAFNYSTSQSHLMGAALAHATGLSLCDFAHEALFDPMGIGAERWGRDPQGYFSGGYNLYMSPRELAKFGQLVLDRGAWEGRQLVPASWVDDAVDEHMVDAGLYYYGYYFWLWRPGGEEINIAWGYGGQLVYTLPAYDMVVVITTNTRDYDPDYDGGPLVWGTLLEGVSE